MKNIISLIFLLCFVAFNIQAQGIEFEHGSWNEVLAKAKQENKIIFVDAYASWCGPCKTMAKRVFPTKEAGDFYNDKFINFKIDLEKGEGPAFAKKYPVRAYPTLMFIDFDGTLVHQKVGGLNASALVELGKEALGKIDRSGQYQVLYDKGDRSPELVYNYIKALNQAGKSSLKIANSYLRSQDDLSTEQNLRIIYEAMQMVDSRIYTLFEKNIKGIQKLYNPEAIDQKVIAAAYKTLSTAIEFQSPELLAEAQDKVKDQCTAQVANAFVANSNLRYAFKLKDYKLYEKALKTYTKELGPQDNITEAYNIVEQGVALVKDKKIASALERLNKKITELPDVSYTHWVTYARLLDLNGKEGEAMEALDQAENLAEGDNRTLQSIKMIRSKMLND
ncbi:MAG: thioredoxin family protein [Bacteroidota bacterium]